MCLKKIPKFEAKVAEATNYVLFFVAPSAMRMGNLFRITKSGGECLHRLPLEYYVTK